VAADHKIAGKKVAVAEAVVAGQIAVEKKMLVVVAVAGIEPVHIGGWDSSGHVEHCRIVAEAGQRVALAVSGKD